MGEAIQQYDDQSNLTHEEKKQQPRLNTPTFQCKSLNINEEYSINK